MLLLMPLHLRRSTIRTSRKSTTAYLANKAINSLSHSAYEIKTLYNEEPPPPDILEKITAKGGDLRRRTVDNFKPPLIRESLANGQDSEGSGGEEIVTPKAEKMEIDDPGSGGGRTTRGRHFVVKLPEALRIDQIII